METKVKFRGFEDWKKTGIYTDESMYQTKPKMHTYEDMLKWNKSSLGSALVGERGEIEITYSLGVTDDEGKEIYEGDILEVNYYSKTKRILVKYFWKGGVMCENIDIYPKSSTQLKNYSKIKIIGNKFENPELLNLKIAQKVI